MRRQRGLATDSSSSRARSLERWPWRPLMRCGPGALRVGLEHLRAVIGLDDEHIGFPDAFADVLRGVAEVGEPGERAARREQAAFAVREEEPHRVMRIVRHGEAFDFEVAETEARAGFEQLPGRAVPEPGLCGARGGGVGKDFYVGKFCEAAEAGGMVAVFVGEKDRIDAAQRLPVRGEQFAQAAGGEAGVHEHARGVGLEQRAIARAAASKDAKSHGH